MTCQTCFLVIFLLVNILGSHALMEDSVHSPNLLMLSSVERKDGWAAGTVSKSHRVLVISEVQESWRYGEYDWVVLRYGLVLVLGVKQTSRLFLTLVLCCCCLPATSFQLHSGHYSYSSLAISGNPAP